MIIGFDKKYSTFVQNIVLQCIIYCSVNHTKDNLLGNYFLCFPVY